MMAQNGPFEQQCIPLYISNRSKQSKIRMPLPVKIRRLPHLRFLQPLKRATRSGSEGFVFCLKVRMPSLMGHAAMLQTMNPTDGDSKARQNILAHRQFW
jgi:hypothetical protein